jgi:TolB-like protein/Flp pilus assembly protein TadD
VYPPEQKTSSASGEFILANGFSSASIHAELEKILASRAFTRADSLGRLLRHLVKQTILGHGDHLKEYSIGVEAFGRGDSFDPHADPIVRVQAWRLRTKLKEYYQNEGVRDPIVFEIPKGCYVPTFLRRNRSASWLPGRGKLIALSCSALILSLLVVWTFSGRAPDRRSAKANHSLGARAGQSIAVLPLRNLSQDPEEEYFVDGLTEALITDLSKISSLQVVSATSVMSYKNTRKSLPEIARQVNADTVVEGAVVRSGGKVRITVQLTDAASDRHLWAETYERDMGDVLELQGEVARKIAAEIRIKLTPREQDRLAGGRRIRRDALQPYLEGRYYASQPTGDALKKSIRFYQHALEKDPGYAPAWAGLAFSHLGLAGRELGPREVMPQAKTAAVKAVQMDETLAEAHAALGSVNLFYDWDWSAAKTQIQQAIELNPSSAVAHSLYAVYFIVMSEPDNAVAEALRAQELDPLSLSTQAFAQLVFFAARDYERASQLGRKALEREPKFAFGRVLTGLAFAKMGRRSDAIAYLNSATRLDDGKYLAAALAHGYAMLGHKSDAHELLDKVKSQSKRRYVCSYELASAYAILGEPDQAFAWFRRAVEERSECLVWARLSPWLDPVRSDPRFEELLRQVGFPVQSVGEIR